MNEDKEKYHNCKNNSQLTNWMYNCKILELYSICLLAVWPVSVSYRHLPVDIRFGIFCTVRFGGSSILWNFAGTPFGKFGRNLFFPQKGGLIHQKGGRSLPLREKRGSHHMYNTKTSRPSFPLVSVGKIPGKYQPIPNRNTKLWYKYKIHSTTAISFAHQQNCT